MANTPPRSTWPLSLRMFVAQLVTFVPLTLATVAYPKSDADFDDVVLFPLWPPAALVALRWLLVLLGLALAWLILGDPRAGEQSQPLRPHRPDRAGWLLCLVVGVFTPLSTPLVVLALLGRAVVSRRQRAGRL